METTDEAAAWGRAFTQVFTLARRLKGEMGVTREMAGRYGEEGARIMAASGFTEDEAVSYLHRIMAMILDEAQA